MDVEYLKKSIGHHLARALAELAQKRPENPIEYLGKYLVALHKKEHGTTAEEDSEESNHDPYSTSDADDTVKTILFELVGVCVALANSNVGDNEELERTLTKGGEETEEDSQPSQDETKADEKYQEQRIDKEADLDSNEAIITLMYEMLDKSNADVGQNSTDESGPTQEKPGEKELTEKEEGPEEKVRTEEEGQADKEQTEEEKEHKEKEQPGEEEGHAEKEQTEEEEGQEEKGQTGEEEGQKEKERNEEEEGQAEKEQTEEEGGLEEEEKTGEEEGQAEKEQTEEEGGLEEEEKTGEEEGQAEKEQTEEAEESEE